MRKGMSDARRISQAEHRKTRKEIASGHSKIIDTLSSKLDDMRPTMPKETVTAELSDRVISFIGESRELLWTPLLLVRDKFRWAVLEVLSHQTEHVSPHLLYWLQSEYDNLISSTAQEVAALSPRSTATSFDRWDYYEAVFSGRGLRIGAVGPGESRQIGGHAGAHIKDTDGKTPQKSSLGACTSFSFHLAIGHLRLTLSHSLNLVNAINNREDVRFFFTPSVDICNTAIAARFTKIPGVRCEPRLYAQLNTFTLVEDIGPTFALMNEGSLGEIDAAFRNGTISPYHVDQLGCLTCLYVSLASVLFLVVSLMTNFCD